MAPLKSYLIFLALSLLFSHSSFSLPTYHRVTLPLPSTIANEDSAMISEVLKLEVYEDSRNANLFYFLPPFHVRQYKTGAAGLMLHAYNIKKYVAAVHELNARAEYAESYSRAAIENLYAQKIIEEEKVEIAREKLAEALATGNEPLIALRKESLDQKLATVVKTISKIEQAEDIIREGGTLLPPGLGRAYFERALLYLSEIGARLPYSGGESPKILTTALHNAFDEVASSYGGFLSLNVYGGFTKPQLDALRQYRAKYMPHITVALLPIDKLTFFPLTEWQKGSSTDGNSKMFNQINGSGDYLGAAIVLDTTIAGSIGLAKHLAPFVIPVGIRASLKQKLEPTKAELRCDFSSGFQVQGRADIKDGLIIYDNDITNTMKSMDRNQGACDLTIISGDRKSAELMALKELESQFEAIRLNRVALSRSEKEAYLNGVLNDIAHNRRSNDQRLSSGISQLFSLNWQGLVLTALAQASDFYWHTNIQDFANVSSIRFQKRISIDGHETIEKDVPTKLCLAFNNDTRSYDRCTEVEESSSTSARDGIAAAAMSAECSGVVDPFTCGRLRENAGLPVREGLVATPVDDRISTDM